VVFYSINCYNNSRGGRRVQVPTGYLYDEDDDEDDDDNDDILRVATSCEPL